MVELPTISRAFKQFDTYFKQDVNSIISLTVDNGVKFLIVRNFTDDIKIKIKNNEDYALKMLRWISEYFIQHGIEKGITGIFSLSYCDLQYPEYIDVISVKFNLK